MSGKYLRRFEEGEVESLAIPSAIRGNRVLIRGSDEWDEREQARARHGCRCLSWGVVSIPGAGRLRHH